jgi:hypothetical protein
MLRPLAEGEPYEVTSVLNMGLRGAPDVALLPAICAGVTRGVLITTDRAMRRRKHEKAAVAATGAVVVVGVANWNQQSELWERARMMLWWWQQIVKSSIEANPGTFLELPWRTNVRPLSRWQVK